MTEASTTEAPAEAEAKPDHEALLGSAFASAAAAWTEEGGIPEAEAKVVADTFRAIPSGARSKAQGLALKAVLMGGGNPEAVEAILDVTNNLPKASSSSRTAPTVSPLEAGTLQATALLVAYAEVTSDPEIGAQIAEAASALYQTEGGLPDTDARKVPILNAAAKAVKATAKRGGGSGDRKRFEDDLADVLAYTDSPIKVGTKLTGPGDAKAVIAKDAQVRVGTGDTAQVFDNLSAAARAVKGGEKSVNGWDFWSVEIDGKSVQIGTLRVK